MTRTDGSIEANTRHKKLLSISDKNVLDNISSPTHYNPRATHKIITKEDDLLEKLTEYNILLDITSSCSHCLQTFKQKISILSTSKESTNLPYRSGIT